MSQAALEAVRERYGAQVLSSHAQAGDETVVVEREVLVDLCTWARSAEGLSMEQLVDVTAIDWQGRKERRYEVVYHLYSLTRKHRLRVKVPLNEDDAKVPTLTGIWRGADWTERETFDMYGIDFEGHPDQRRLLLYDGFEGHPLRKDFPVRGYQPLIEMPSLPLDVYDPED